MEGTFLCGTVLSDISFFAFFILMYFYLFLHQGTKMVRDCLELFLLWLPWNNLTSKLSKLYQKHEISDNLRVKIPIWNHHPSPHEMSNNTRIDDGVSSIAVYLMTFRDNSSTYRM